MTFILIVVLIVMYILLIILPFKSGGVQSSDVLPARDAHHAA